jgi:diguanylate cyclase (GGDEF)-like protein
VERVTARRPDIAEPEPTWTTYGPSDPTTAEQPTESLTAEPAGERGVDHGTGTEITEQTGIGQRAGTLLPALAPAIAEQRRNKPVTSPDGPEAELADTPPNLSNTPSDNAKLVRLHESIATLLAARGEFRQAYHHLRSALNLVSVNAPEQLPIPEQFRREVDRLRREHAEAREQSIRDSLTASYNRRYLDQRLTAMLAADTGASQDGFAIALVDLDWFKQVNDRFGHLLGDRVLQHVVELLSDGLPEPAFCARYGGEEFVLVLPDIDMTSAIAVAEAARTRVERAQWSALAPGLQVTVSIGLAYEAPSTPARRQPTSAEQQLLRADSLLYAAKQSGRNAVAYRHAGRVTLTGTAANRRWVAEPRAAR